MTFTEQELGRSPDRRQTDRREVIVDERLRSMGWAIGWRNQSTIGCVLRDEAVLVPLKGASAPSRAS